MIFLMALLFLKIFTYAVPDRFSNKKLNVKL
jgi:hypothetical protein